MCSGRDGALAGSSATNGVAPRAKSMQNAFTAVADDPSAIFYNPAGLTQIAGTEIDAGLMLILPELEYTNSTTGVASRSTQTAVGYNVFLSTDVVTPVTLGFGVYAPFARVTDYTATAAVGRVSHTSELLRIDFVPTVATKVGPHVSLGMGFVASYVRVNSDILGFEEEGSGYGFTGQGGVLFQLHPRVKLGLTYRGPMAAQVHGSGTLVGVGTDQFEATVRFPGTLSLGLAWQALDVLLLAVSVDWEMWSAVKEIRRQYTNPVHQRLGVTVLNAHDAYNVRLGLLYTPWRHGEWRVGYAYLTAAVPANHIVPAFPDYNGHAVAVGYGQTWKQWRVDIGYEWITSPPRQSQNAVFPGTYTVTNHVLLLGLAVRLDGAAHSRSRPQ
jgi:long-chain fatty acid transport protein